MGEERSRPKDPYLENTKAPETNEQQINKTLLLYIDIHREKTHEVTEVSHVKKIVFLLLSVLD